MSVFDHLKKFITKDMAMSQVYQPVMLIELLQNHGHATVAQIAQAILNHDPSQIEYYSSVVKNMVGKVLTKNREITTKEGNEYHLKDADSLSPSEITELISLCREQNYCLRNKKKWCPLGAQTKRQTTCIRVNTIRGS